MKAEELLERTLTQYQQSFNSKAYSDENSDHDVLMDVFGISPQLKRENRQYWGRELGMCWQLLITRLCKSLCHDYRPPVRSGLDEPYDLQVANYAIDTKYRIGSGDSGTLKKFKSYGPLIKEQGLQPVLLIVRNDNLDAAIAACKSGGWSVYTGEQTFEFVTSLTGFDIKDFLRRRAGVFSVER